MMEINDFSALIQLTATMSIAFVAVEYVKSYTCILCENFFKFHDFIKQAFNECRDKLIDEVSLSNLQPNSIDGKSTNTMIEEAKRKHEELNKRIDETEKLKINDLDIACQAHSMSSLCFSLFMFNLLLLFIGGIEKMSSNSIHVFSTIFCGLFVLFLVIGWCVGENEKPKKYRDFSSLKYVTISFGIIIVISVIISKCLFLANWSAYIIPYWNYLLIVSICCSYLNFIVFVIKIWNKAKDFKNTVSVSKKELEKDCEDAASSVSDLLVAGKLSDKLKAD